MTQIQINMDSELLHGLFSKEGRDEAFSRLFLPLPFPEVL